MMSRSVSADQTFPQGDSRSIKFRTATQWILLAGLLSAIVFFRSPDVFLLPSLEAEDGTFVFPHYYANRDLAELSRFQAGYIPLVLNLIAYLSVRLPTQLIPYGFALLPAALALVASLWLFRRDFRPWLGPDSTRVAICVLIVLAPLIQYHVYANATYSIWTALILFLFMVVTPTPSRWWRSACIWVAANVLVWSNPLTPLAAPILVVRFMRDARSRLPCALTLANLVCYAILGIEKGGLFADLTWIESFQKIFRAFGWTFVIVGEAAFRTAVGAPGLNWALANAWPLIAAWAALLAIVAIVAAVQSSRLRIVFALLGYVIFAFTFTPFLSRGMTMLPLDGAPRYVYVQTIAFLLMFVLLLEHFLINHHPRWRSLAAGAVAAWYVALNVQLGHYFFTAGETARSQDSPPSLYVQSHEGNGLIVRQFFAELAALERQTGSRRGIRLSLDKPADWPIVIDTVSPP